MSTIPKFHSHSVDNEDLLETESKNNWYVLYTAPRAEKIVEQELGIRGYEVFLPITKTLRVYKSRNKRMIDKVLFPSYIFVYTQESYLHKICQVPKIMTFIHCGGKPSKIHFKCIDGIKQMLNLDQEISVDTNFTEGEEVSIINGPLAGYEGVLVKQKSKTRFGIQLKEINQTVFIDICTSMVGRKSYSI